MRTVLNVGSGTDKDAGPYFVGWNVATLDIDPRTGADYVMDARLLATLEPDSFDAVHCSHTLEHFTPPDCRLVLVGALHVLKPEGGLHVLTPDIASVEEKLDAGQGPDDVLYVSPAGPITANDVIHGYQPAIEAGNDFMRHRTSFTAHTLRQTLVKAGFRDATVIRHQEWYALEAFATCPGVGSILQTEAKEHLGETSPMGTQVF